MDHLMAENTTKIIKTAKWGKSHQKNLKKKIVLITDNFLNFGDRWNKV